MSNMSYCRFQNTLHDLRDCAAALEDLFNSDVEHPLSREELAAAKALVSKCADIVATVSDQQSLDVNETHEWIEFEDRYEKILDEANAEIGEAA